MWEDERCLLRKGSHTMSMHAPRSADPIDAHVGTRIRERRQQLRMSQGALGELLGITFQQVQKYERGSNRVGAGRLWKLADVLGVDVAYFYKGVERTTPLDEVAEGEQTPYSHHHDLNAEQQEIVDVISRISNPAIRKKILELARSLADEPDS